MNDRQYYFISMMIVYPVLTAQTNQKMVVRFAAITVVERAATYGAGDGFSLGV